MRKYRALLGLVAVVVLFLAGTRWSPFEPHRPSVDSSGAGDHPTAWADSDWGVFEAAVERSVQARLDTLPMGELIAEIGRSFVGTAYVPRTLEVEGPERLVINFRELDCVTFVENVLSVARLVKSDVGSRLSAREGVEREYAAALTAFRYRDRTINGYGSRLHYFTDWIGDAEVKGLLLDITDDLGGVADRERINFMSTHVGAYRQLTEAANLERVGQTERRLSAMGRRFIPENKIADISHQIRNGDVIAATSTVEGLDVAHTGLALWVDGTLRLMHAPLVGDVVQISEETLAERILRIAGQDGIIVARLTEG